MTKMTDSGIDWIGEIPEEWGVARIKMFASIERGASPRPIDKYISGDDGVNWIRIGDAEKGNKYITSTKLKITKIGAKLSKYVVPGTLILSNSMSFGQPYIISIFGCIHDGWLSLTPSSKIHKEYLYWFLLSDVCLSQFQYLSVGAVVENLSVDKVGNTVIVVPSLVEQTKIADYLDKKVAQLDKAKTLLEEQIATLQDYRQSLIYETVTKGLDKNAPLKESGVDWIGEIPEGWKVRRLKYVLVIKDGTHDTPDYFDEGIPLITSKNLDSIKNTIDFETAKNISFEDYQKINRRSNVSEGDIIMPMIGTIGGAVQVLTDEKFSIKNVALFKTVENQFLSRYLYYQLNSSIVNGQFEFMMSGGVQSFVSLTMLGELRVIVPDTTSMYQVTDFLDKKTAQINKMIAIKQEQIDNINQQRQTLIYDLVTGKRRV